MITKRLSQERGYADHGWLKSHHTFSFADYHDPSWMGFRSLRVINEDWVAAGQGFGKHPHRDMEIVTVVLEGALEHNDSMGNTSVITPGEIQRMSAGTGVLHSEFNHSPDAQVHLLQIWILPSQKGLTPSYEQKSFPFNTKDSGLILIASDIGGAHAVRVHQDVKLYFGKLDHISQEYQLERSRGVWVHIIDGQMTINDIAFTAGDSAIIEKEDAINFHSKEQARFLLFDLG